MSPESESVSKIWCFPPWIRIEVEMQSGFRSSSNLSGIRKLNVSMWEVSYVFFLTKYSPFFKTLVRASFSTASLISQLVKNRTPVRFLGQDICWRRDRLPTPVFLGLPCGSAGKESACNEGDLGFIPGLERSPEGGKDYPLQCSGLEKSMNWIVHGVAKCRRMTE